MLDDLIELDADVFLLLIPGQQLFPRPRQILIGRQDGNQGAEGQFVLYDQIAANREKEKGCKFVNEVVEKFDKKFAPINFKTNIVNTSQPVAKFRQLILRRIVRMHFNYTRDSFANMIRQAPDILHALFRKHIHFALQLWDCIHLKGIKRDRGAA